MHQNIIWLVRIALGMAVPVGIAAAAWADPFTGPKSPYYLNNYDDQRIYVVQGTKVIDSFPWSYACGNIHCEANLAIAGGYVNTNWFGDGYFGGNPGIAGQYTLSGTPTGVSWTNSPLPSGPVAEFIPDGTSDGIRIFAAESFSSPTPTQMIAYDLQWQNPTPLFVVYFQITGVTYDPVDSALWTSGAADTTLTEWSLTGAKFKEFRTSVQLMPALAYDPADDTLWFNDSDVFYQKIKSNVLYQYSKNGELLQSGVPDGLPLGLYSAGEIAGVGIAAVPEPGSLALLGTGLAGLWVALRRRNRLSA